MFTINVPKFFLILLLVVSVLTVSYYVLNRSTALINQPAIVLGHELQSIDECISSTLEHEKKDQDKIDFKAENQVFTSINDKFQKISGACYEQIRWQGLLNDFQIRRAKFAIQYESEKVILWMVVVLTLSGVMLAALQLGATYQLAKLGQSNGLEKDHEFTIERGKVVLRSSVTGLFILVFSFAFFYIYIHKVFTINELPTTEAPTLTTSDSNNNFSSSIMGSLLPPSDKNINSTQPTIKPDTSTKDSKDTNISQ